VPLPLSSVMVFDRLRLIFNHRGRQHTSEVRAKLGDDCSASIRHSTGLVPSFVDLTLITIQPRLTHFLIVLHTTDVPAPTFFDISFCVIGP
jgi:hypothetical protein